MRVEGELAGPGGMVGMSASEFCAALEVAGWSVRWFAAATGRSRDMVYAWSTGARDVPADIAAWLRRHVARLVTDPPPRSRSGNERPGRPKKESRALQALLALNEPATLNEVASAAHTLCDSAVDFRMLRDSVERSLRYLVITGRVVKIPTRPATYAPVEWRIGRQTEG